MSPVIEVHDLSKRYGTIAAVDRVRFTIEPGRIVGLIGPNGAGKTSILRALLGLSRYTGRVRVLGHEPFRERAALMREVAYIADVAVLPAWLRVEAAVEFVAGVHPNFRRERARMLLQKARIPFARRIGDLSKGMKTQVHLALAMAIDAKLLVLDEPTLGLDPIARRAFYDALVEDYIDRTRTVLLTTHQVEEVEHLLTDVLFVDGGRIVLDATLDSLRQRYTALVVAGERLAEGRALQPFYERPVIGGTELYFEDAAPAALADLGEPRSVGIADLFVAKLSRGRDA